LEKSLFVSVVRYPLNQHESFYFFLLFRRKEHIVTYCECGVECLHPANFYLCGRMQFVLFQLRRFSSGCLPVGWRERCITASTRASDTKPDLFPWISCAYRTLQTSKLSPVGDMGPFSVRDKSASGGKNSAYATARLNSTVLNKSAADGLDRHEGMNVRLQLRFAS
jgi:hypothetical protein